MCSNRSLSLGYVHDARGNAWPRTIPPQKTKVDQNIDASKELGKLHTKETP